MPDETLIGKTLGRYRITEHIGSGGMADVYKAIQESLGRSVALKVLPREYARDEGMVRRFHREARSAGRLSHPNIVTIYEDGLADDVHYFAMEYVEGNDLKNLIAGTGPLPPEQAREISKQVCDALSYAHERGVVHRDIKPANIMITPEGRVVVTDFGIAKAADSTRLTQTGTSMGTPEYMAPEQISGSTDHHSDLYSLGIVLYEIKGFANGKKR